MSSNKTKKRIIYLDYLRVLAILGVLINHISATWGHMAFNGNVALVYNSLGKIGVPVFLMLTGVLLLNNKLPISSFIKRRYPRVLIPFIFWIALFIIYDFFVLRPELFNGNIINQILLCFFTYRWYVWMILGVYLIIPIFAAFIKNSKLEGVKYFLIIWYITTALFTLSILFDFQMKFLDLVIFSGPIGYLMLGYYLHNKEFKINPKKIVVISVILFIILTVFKAYMLNADVFNPYKFRYVIFLTRSKLDIDTISILQAAFIFLLFKYIPKVKSGFFKKISGFCNKKTVLALIISISQASYGIYLNHYFIVAYLKDIHFPFKSFPSIIFVPIFAISILFISYGIILILNKVPIINKLTGYH